MLEILLWRIRILLRGIHTVLWPWSHPTLSFRGRAFVGLIWLLGFKTAPGAKATQAKLDSRAAQAVEAGPRSVKPPPVPMKLASMVQIQKDESLASGWPVFIISPTSSAPSRTNATPSPLILYTHGGAYTATAQPSHFTYLYDLCARTGALIVAPLYPLAPQHNYRETFNVLPKLAQRLRAKDSSLFPNEEHLLSILSDTNRFVLMGDSAGGGIAMALALQIAEEDAPQADEVVLISPWLDVTVSEPAAAQIEPDDPWLRISVARGAGRMWAGLSSTVQDSDSTLLHNPVISPLYTPSSTLTKLTSRVSIGVGSLDVLAPEAGAMVQKLRQAKSSAVTQEDRAICRVTPGMFHVFVLVSDACKEMSEGRAWFAQRVMGL